MLWSLPLMSFFEVLITSQLKGDGSRCAFSGVITSKSSGKQVVTFTIRTTNFTGMSIIKSIHSSCSRVLIFMTPVTLSSGSGPLSSSKNLMSLRHALTVTRPAMIIQSNFRLVFLLTSLIHSMKITVLRTACSQSIEM
jgi:hypothetical protein